MNVRYTIFSETTFCDYEFDKRVRARYLEWWKESLKQTSMLLIDDKCALHQIIYISDDKVEELAEIRRFLGTLRRRSDRINFHLVTYTHRPEGYGASEGDHIDLIKNPTKFPPYCDALFASALAQLPPVDDGRIIRIALDSDDWWLPWHLLEVVRAAEQAFEAGKTIGVGLAGALVAYMQDLTVDQATLSRIMTGNKFVVADAERLQKVIEVSPWRLPETFSSNESEKARELGLELKLTGDNRPGWVYGRWGTNLTPADKSRYYTAPPARMTFPSQADLF